MIAIQSPTGERFQGSFPSSSTVEHVMITLSSNNPKFPRSPTPTSLGISFMNQQITDWNSTLSQLGLTRGSGLLRLQFLFSNDSPAPLSKMEVEESKVENLTHSEDTKIVKEEEKESHVKEEQILQKDEVKEVEGMEIDEEKTNLKIEEKQNERKKENEVEEGKEEKEEQEEKEEKEEKKEKKETEEREKKQENEKEQKEEKEIEEKNEQVAEDRNVKLWAPSQVSRKEEELPDTFYEHSLADLRALQPSSRADEILKTKQMREAEAAARRPVFRRTRLKIRFPNRWELEGEFLPSESVSDLRAFVAQHLSVSAPFYLYTSPPVVRLPSKGTFSELKLVPSAVILLGWEQKAAVQEPFFPPSTLARLANSESPVTNTSSSPSTSSTSSSSLPPKETSKPTSSKGPKWFMAGKKK